MPVELYTVKTPNFKYTLRVEEDIKPLHIMKFSVGDSKHVCLDASIFMPDIDSRFHDITHICKLHRIDAIQECALEYDSNASFGTELLFSFITIIRSNFPHITEIQLSDSSYIPCNRLAGDTLDLLTYSIALYGKTWYEKSAGAYITNSLRRETYTRDIGKYMSPETKQYISFANILNRILQGNIDTYAIINNDLERYEAMYDSSNTLPDFFLKLSKTVEKYRKCRFFKGWLESFIESYVYIVREWTIDLIHNDSIATVLNNRCVRPMSRTRKNTSRNFQKKSRILRL